MTWGIVAMAGASLVGSMIAADSAGDAAQTQSESAASGVAENRRQFDEVRKLLNPYVQAGEQGLARYGNLAGTNGQDIQRLAIEEVRNGSEFNALANAGEQAILANASATGGLRGGNTQQALASSRTNLLNNLINQQMGRFGNLANIGQNSAAGVGSAAMNMGSQNAALMQQGGAAIAGGQMAAGGYLANSIAGIGGLMGQRIGAQPAQTFNAQPYIGMPEPYGAAF